MGKLDDYNRKYSRKVRKWRDKVLRKGGVTPEQVEAAATEAVTLLAKHDAGEKVTIQDAVGALLGILTKVGISLALALASALLLAGCKGKGEQLDWSQRPAPDAISQPYGRYPLGQSVPVWFDASGVYPSPRHSVPDGLAELAAGTIEPVLAEYSQYAAGYCLDAPLVDSEAAALVRVRLYYCPLGRAASWLDLSNDCQLLEIEGAPAEAIKAAAASASQPPNGYSGLCQLVAHGNTLVAAQVWLNVWPLEDFLRQGKALYPNDPPRALAWALEQWGIYLRLVGPHELTHALFGLADEPQRSGPGMMRNSQLSGEFNAAETATARWLRSCPAKASGGIKITAGE